MDLTLQNIEALIKLVSEHKLDSLKLGDLEIHKTLHEVKEDKMLPSPTRMSNEELMFAAGAAELPPEIVEQFIRPRRRTTEE